MMTSPRTKVSVRTSVLTTGPAIAWSSSPKASRPRWMEASIISRSSGGSAKEPYQRSRSCSQAPMAAPNSGPRSISSRAWRPMGGATNDTSTHTMATTRA